LKKIEHSFILSRDSNTRIIATSDIIKETEDQIELLKEELISITDLLEIWKVHNWSNAFEFRSKERQKLSCGRPFRGPLQVQVDGTVNMCGFDYNGELLLGDLKSQSINDIFNSEEYKRIVDFHSDINSWDDLLCNGCDQLRNDLGSVIYNSKFKPEDRVGRLSTNYQRLD